MAKKKTIKAKKATKKTVKKVAKVAPVPKGYHQITPHIIVKGASDAIKWYQKAFGAKELQRMTGPDGRIMHAEIRIGDSILMLSDEMPERENNRRAPSEIGASTEGMMMYVKDCDAWFNKAVAAGAKVNMPLTDMFWGDRYGQLQDPYGHVWALATRKANMTPKQMQKATDEAMRQAQQQAA